MRTITKILMCTMLFCLVGCGSVNTEAKVDRYIDKYVDKAINKVVDTGLKKLDGKFGKWLDKDKETKTAPVTDEGEYEYNGDYNVTVGKADFTIKIKDGVHYGELDELGRPTYATARVTKAIIQKEKKEKREPIKVDPVGWRKKNPKVKIHHKDGTTYKGFMWNRSHMIADSLGGDPIVENLVTGTRPQNVGGRKNNGGMAYLETKIRKYFDKKSNKGYVDYTVENVYVDDELLPRYSICNAKSSDGKIDEKVIVFNVAEGFDINYHNAEVREK